MLKFLSVLRRVPAIALFGLVATATSLPLFAQHFTRTDLTVDLSSVSPSATNLDSHLQNSWGLTRSATSDWWVADNHTGLSTLYDATGAPQTLVVSIPTLDGTSTAAPTGTAFNYTTGFEIAPDETPHLARTALYLPLAISVFIAPSTCFASGPFFGTAMP